MFPNNLTGGRRYVVRCYALLIYFSLENSQLFRASLVETQFDTFSDWGLVVDYLNMLGVSVALFSLYSGKIPMAKTGNGACATLTDCNVYSVTPLVMWPALLCCCSPKVLWLTCWGHALNIRCNYYHHKHVNRVSELKQ